MCDACKMQLANRNPPEKPDCKACRVELLPANFDAANIFRTCRNQLRTKGPENKPFAPDLTAVLGVMGVSRIKDQRGCLDKVVAAFAHFIKKGNS